jgi:hypothetical protein
VLSAATVLQVCCFRHCFCRLFRPYLTSIGLETFPPLPSFLLFDFIIKSSPHTYILEVSKRERERERKISFNIYQHSCFMPHTATDLFFFSPSCSIYYRFYLHPCMSQRIVSLFTTYCSSLLSFDKEV